MKLCSYEHKTKIQVRRLGFFCRSEEAQTPDILTSCHLRCPKLFARCSLHTISTATPTNAPCFRHRRRSRVLPKAGKHLLAFRMSRIKVFRYKNKKSNTEWYYSFYGRSEEARTPDILLPKQARYQLRYTPILSKLNF